jgi:hypothetical protein
MGLGPIGLRRRNCVLYSKCFDYLKARELFVRPTPQGYWPMLIQLGVSLSGMTRYQVLFQLISGWFQEAIRIASGAEAFLHLGPFPG